MKATCPQDPGHKEFVMPSVPVDRIWKQEDWLVDSAGNFLDVYEEEYQPEPDNCWTCAVCGTRAQMED